MVGKTWLRYVLVYLMQAIISLIAFIPLILSLFNFDLIKDYIDNPEELGEIIQSNPELLFSFLGPDGDFTGLIIGGSLFTIFVVILSAWAANVNFKLNDAVIRGKEADISAAIGKSFDACLSRLVGLGLVTFIIYGALVGTAILIAYLVHWALALLLVPLALMVVLRLIIAMPAVVHGGYGVSEAISLSFKHITWARALKIAAIGIGFMVVIVIAAMIIGAVSFLLLLIPLLGFIIYYAIQLSFSGILNALTFGAMSGLYFRYEPIQQADDDISKHLTDQI
jgi:hypothetical protein